MSYTLPAWADLPATTSSLSTVNFAMYNTAINDIDTRINTKQANTTITAVKTSNYTANAGEYVPVDTTSGNITVTFPTAPANGTQVGVKHVVRGGVNVVTLALGGSDHFNTTTGPTSGPLTLLNQDATFQYVAATAVWISQSDDLPLSQLDIRYKNVPVALTFATPLNTNAALGNYFRATLTSNFTLANPTNAVDGQEVTWELLQDATGSRLITLDTQFSLGGFTATLSTGAAKRDFLTAVFNSVTTKWYITQFSKNY